MASPTEVSLTIVASTANAEAGLSRVATAADTHLGNLGSSSEKAGGKLSALGDTTEGVAKKAGSATSGMKSMVEGFAAAAVIGEVSQEYEANEKALTSLRQGMKDAGEKETPQFVDALKKAQDAGVGMGFESSNTTEAMAQLRLGGLSTAQAFSSLPTIMDLARAKNIDLATATGAVVKGLQGNGKALKDLNVELPPHIATTAQLDAANVKVAAGTAAVTAAQDKYTAAVKLHGPHSKEAIAAAAALEKAHVTLTAEQAKAKDAADGVGDRTKNLGALMDTLGDKVGGQAQAHTKDMGVQWDILKGHFNEVGGAVIQKVMPAFSALLSGLGFLAANANVVLPIVGAMAAAFVALKIASGIGGVLNAASDAVKGVGSAFTMLEKHPIIAVLMIVALALVALEAKFHFVEAAVRILGPVFSAIGKVIGDVIHNIATVVGAVFAVIVKVVGNIVEAFRVPFEIVGKVIGVYISVWVAIFKGLVSAIGVVLTPVIAVVSAILGIVGDVFSVAFAVIGKVIGAAVSAIGPVIHGIVDVVQGVADVVTGIFNTMSGVISTIWTGISTVVTGIWGVIVAAIKVPINLVIGAINGIIGLIDALQIHIPKVGLGPLSVGPFDWNGLNISKIPSLAGGSDWLSSPMLAIIGDNPRGERVQTRDQADAERRSGAGSSSRPVNINIAVATNADPHAIAREMAWGWRTRVPV